VRPGCACKEKEEIKHLKNGNGFLRGKLLRSMNTEVWDENSPSFCPLNAFGTFCRKSTIQL
jgi:hypothetical protein